MTLNPQFYQALMQDISLWAREMGFQAVGVSDTDLSSQEKQLDAWLAQGFQGTMDWIGAHGTKRSRPAELHPGTTRVISVRMNYLPGDTDQIKILKDLNKAYVARYALGRDYHKLIRKRLSQLAKKIEDAVKAADPSFVASQRAFVDSAPVMERPLAEKAGLGWMGKNTLVLHENAGSWFFLGEIYTNIPLPINTAPVTDQCAQCTACLQVCPTDAFPEAYVMDARRCISYLTIENKDEIPEEFREPIGNRIFGCDDCQAICPWNKFASHTQEPDFHPRHALDKIELLSLFKWDEQTYLKNTEGSAIRRIGYERWQRNIIVGLGNAPHDGEIIKALEAKKASASDMLLNHIEWALEQQRNLKRKRKRKIKRVTQ